MDWQGEIVVIQHSRGTSVITTSVVSGFKSTLSASDETKVRSAMRFSAGSSRMSAMMVMGT